MHSRFKIRLSPPALRGAPRRGSTGTAERGRVPVPPRARPERDESRDEARCVDCARSACVLLAARAAQRHISMFSPIIWRCCAAPICTFLPDIHYSRFTSPHGAWSDARLLLILQLPRQQAANRVYGSPAAASSRCCRALQAQPAAVVADDE